MCVFHYFNKIIKQLAIILIFISVLLGGGEPHFLPMPILSKIKNAGEKLNNIGKKMA